MNKPIFILLFFLTGFSFNTEAQRLEWFKQFNAKKSSFDHDLNRGYSIKSDNNGNAYAVGITQDSVGFNSKSYISKNMDFFLVKFDAKGNVLWLKTISYEHRIIGFLQGWMGYPEIVVSASGTVYLKVPVFHDNRVIIDSQTFKAPRRSFLLAKFSPAGKLSWIKPLYSVDSTFGVSYLSNEASHASDQMGIDKNENLYVPGIYGNGVKFYGGPAWTSATTNYFVGKYDSSGSLQWATNTGKWPNIDSYGRDAYCLSVDPEGNSIMAESFSYTLEVNGKLISNNNPYKISIAAVKLDKSGHILYGKEIASYNFTWNSNCFLAASLMAIRMKPDGSFYFGQAYTSMNFQKITLSGDGNNYNNSYVSCFASYDTKANVKWAKAVPSASWGWYRQSPIQLDKQGNVWFASTFTDSIQFDSFKFNVPYPSFGTLLHKIDSNGKITWSGLIDIFDANWGFVTDRLDIDFDASRNIYIAGFLTGNLNLFGHSFKSKDEADGFFAKTGTSCIGLPPFKIQITKDTVCQDKAVTLSASKEKDASWLWQPSGSNSASGSTTETVKVQWQSPGRHDITLVRTVAGECRDTAHTSIWVQASLKNVIKGPVLVCTRGQVSSYAADRHPGSSYTWSVKGGSLLPDSGNRVKISWNDSTENYLSMTETNGACSFTGSLHVKRRGIKNIDLGPDRYLCEEDGDMVQLDAGPGYITYLWRPGGDTTESIIVRREGDYFVVVQDECGGATESNILIKRKCSPRFFMPTSFTPNNDGLNDMLIPKADNILEYNFKVFDRWGEEVFSSAGHEAGWNGLLRGRPCESGMYFWLGSYTYNEGKTSRQVYLKGEVVLSN